MFTIGCASCEELLGSEKYAEVSHETKVWGQE